MDSLDKLNSRMKKLNGEADRLARFIRKSGWSGSVQTVKYGDQTSDPAIVLSAPTTDEEIRISYSPDGSANVWEGLGISRNIGPGFSIGDVLRILYDDYSEMEDTPWNEAVS